MKVEEIFFREMYRQLCLLTNFDAAKESHWRDVFDLHDDEEINGLLTYAYIGDEGLTFEVLAGAQLDGERLKIFPASYKKSFKLKRAVVNDAELRILSDDYAVAFRDKICVLNDKYSDDAREQTRKIKTLDAFRHPDYPDDVVVYFLDAEHKPELLWVRCLSVDENILAGELLNEPRSNFGCHAGDLIKFGVAQVNGQNILLHLPTN